MVQQLIIYLREQGLCAQSLSCVRLFVTPWTVAHQTPLSMRFSRQECWSGLPCPPPGDLPHPGMEPRSPSLQADSLPSEPQGSPTVQGIWVKSLVGELRPHMCVCDSRSGMSNSLGHHGLQPTWHLCPWSFPGDLEQISSRCNF